MRIEKEDKPNLQLLMDARDIGVSKAIFKIIKKERDLQRAKIEKDGYKLSNDNLRYKLGVIHLCNEILELPDRARVEHSKETS